MAKRVYIAYTGGTIGMRKTADGYRPIAGFLSEQLAKLPEMKHPLMPRYELHEYEPLIDSANISPKWWVHIARDIAAHYDAFDGFVVLHGTDTMAYTASALPFMLQGLSKPVILTGSQIPLCELRNDAKDNLVTAMLIAANYRIPEVCLFFGNRLLRGNRSVKVNADGFDAFASPKFPDLGVAGVGIEIQWDLILPPPQKEGPVSVKAFSDSRVAVLRLFPGIAADVMHNIAASPVRGLVLETYGAGNAPDNDPGLLSALKEASDRGVIIVSCTQCLRGRVRMDDYATGTALSRSGVINGHDMTIEAALAKLFFLLSRKLSIEEVRTMMQKELRGELTLPVLSK